MHARAEDAPNVTLPRRSSLPRLPAASLARAFFSQTLLQTYAICFHSSVPSDPRMWTALRYIVLQGTAVYWRYRLCVFTVCVCVCLSFEICFFLSDNLWRNLFFHLATFLAKCAHCFSAVNTMHCERAASCKTRIQTLALHISCAAKAGMKNKMRDFVFCIRFWSIISRA